MTDNKIVKALRIGKYRNCQEAAMRNVINRQEAEIEQLQSRNECLELAREKILKNEVIKEFVDKLKKDWFHNGYESPDVNLAILSTIL